MKKLILMAAATLLSAQVAFAQTAAPEAAGDKKPAMAENKDAAEAPAKKELTPQQQKMKNCNSQAVGKKGDERKAFMKECLSGAKATDASVSSPQQEKMKACNKDAGAKGLKGEDRKNFMSACLKG